MTAAGSGNVWLAGCVRVVAGGGCSVAAVTVRTPGGLPPHWTLSSAGPASPLQSDRERVVQCHLHLHLHHLLQLLELLHRIAGSRQYVCGVWWREVVEVMV